MIRRARREPPKEAPPSPLPPPKPVPDVRQKRQDRSERSKASRAGFGLGDAVAGVLANVGLTEERVSKWLGRPCGCKERKRKLNRLSDWVKAKLRGEDLPPPEGME